MVTPHKNGSFAQKQTDNFYALYGNKNKNFSCILENQAI